MDRQPSSDYCFLCGLHNPIGLKLTFYNEAQDCVSARFCPAPEHQGYPGVLHGGITCALLDETIGRILVQHDAWGMTVDLAVRYHKPIPIGETLIVVGELTRLRSRMMEGRGETRLADGTVAASAEARYILLSEAQVEAFRDQLGDGGVLADGGGTDITPR
jgi:acyl-coenzyme A thioesterase PaaI-like protein